VREAIQSEIDAMAAEHAQFLTENLQIHEEVMKLEHEFESITKALDSNLESVKANTEELSIENDELREEIDERQAVIDEIRDQYLSLVGAETDLSSVSGLDLSFLAEITGVEPGSFRGGTNVLDPEVFKLVCTYPEFANCHTNEDAVERCRLLIGELAVKEAEEEKNLTDAERFGRRLSEELELYHRKAAKAAYEMKRLLAERDELENGRNAIPSFMRSDLSTSRDSTKVPPYGVRIGSLTSPTTSNGRTKLSGRRIM
jgi:hypothetical protein